MIQGVLIFLIAGISFGYEMIPPKTDCEGVRYQHKCFCQAPNMNLLMDRFRESLAIPDSEQYLKEIVTEPQNHELREQIKSNYRRLYDARMREKPRILSETQKVFEEIITRSNVREGIIDFPAKGSRAEIKAQDNYILMKTQYVDAYKINFLPPEVLKKFTPGVEIRYFYPIDRFEYVLTYDGQDLPADRAINAIQNDFEAICEAQYKENMELRESNKKGRSSSSGTSRQ